MSSNEREFPTIEELSQGFSEFRLPQVREFAGKEIVLNYEDGTQAIYHFYDDEVLKVIIRNGEREEKSTAVYTAVSPRNEIYVIDFVKSYGDTVSITTVLDLKKKIATTMEGKLPTREEVEVSLFERGDKGLPMTSVKASFKSASVNSPFTKDTEKHEFTEELIGERIRFQYSSKDAYEHIYLNEKFYVWHCLSGIEKGLCDTDRCYYLKLDEKLYWFTWCEKVVPTIGTVVEDLAEDAMRSYGKIYGYEDYNMGRVTNFPVGSYATVLNKTEY